jgi:hypothetical protein
MFQLHTPFQISKTPSVPCPLSFICTCTLVYALLALLSVYYSRICPSSPSFCLLQSQDHRYTVDPFFMELLILGLSSCELFSCYFTQTQYCTQVYVHRGTESLLTKNRWFWLASNRVCVLAAGTNVTYCPTPPQIYVLPQRDWVTR